MMFFFTWLIVKKRTAHFIVVDDVSVPAEKKSKMMLDTMCHTWVKVERVWKYTDILTPIGGA